MGTKKTILHPLDTYIDLYSYLSKGQHTLGTSKDRINRKSCGRRCNSFFDYDGLQKNLIFLWLIGKACVIILYSEQCQTVREFLSEPERRKEVVIVSR